MLYLLYSVWLNTRSNPVDIDQLQSHTGKLLKFNLFIILLLLKGKGNFSSIQPASYHTNTTRNKEDDRERTKAGSFFKIINNVNPTKFWGLFCFPKM